jgi:O-antigen/teichoic acid export membrane protein
MSLSLRKRAVTGFKWMGLKTCFNTVLSISHKVMLARLLGPREFGYMAIILVVVGWFDTFRNMGISQAVVQTDEVSNDDISTIFYFNVIISGLLAILIIFLSPILSESFGFVELLPLLRMTSLLVIITGPALIFQAIIERELLFKSYSILLLLSEASYVVLSIVLIYVGYGVLGIIYGQIFSKLLLTVGLVIIVLKTNYRLTLCFSFQRLRRFLTFGLFVGGKQILTMFTQHLDEIIIAASFSAEVLGVYHFGKSLLQKVQYLLTNSFSQILLPLLAKQKNNMELLSNTYLHISKMVGFIAIPLFLGIAVTADVFVPFLFGPEWISSIYIIQVLSISNIFLVLTANLATSCLYSINKPYKVLLIDIICNCLYLLALLKSSSYGITFVLYTFVTYIILKTFLLQWAVLKELAVSILAYLSGFWHISVSALIMLFTAYTLKQVMLASSVVPVVFQLISIITVSILVVGCTIYLLERTFIRDVFRIMNSKRTD